MALFTESEVRSKAQNAIYQDQLAKSRHFRRNASEILNEQVTALNATNAQYDIFLSHSSRDAELIFGTKLILEELGYKVYVDWIEDKHLDRDRVSPLTAETLKRRMLTSRSLLYVTTQNAENSKWMPWECGYFDGKKEKVAILPVKKQIEYHFLGQEYLGLYPYSTKGPNRLQQEKLWIYRQDGSYLIFDEWVSKKNAELEWNKS